MFALGCGSPSSEDGGGSSSDTTTGTGTTAAATGSCIEGSEGCACYANQTCNVGLSCFSGLCVDPGGGTVGTTSATGTGTTFGTTSAGTGTTTATGGSTTETVTATGSLDTTGIESTSGTTTLAEDDSTGGTSTPETSLETSGDPAESSGDETSVEELPLVLTPNENGWVSRTENRLGIQGPWFTFTSAMGGVISPAEGEVWAPSSGGAMCMSGSTAEVPCDIEDECDYENYWGVAGALHLCFPGEGDPTPAEGDAFPIGDCPWADFSDVLGFRFRITGDVPDGARLVFDEASYESSPFVPITVTGRVEARFADADDPYADPGHALNVDDVTSLMLQISASPTGDIEFDEICISEVEPILAD